ncbi:Serine proteinase stubble, partial [Stegodyphus mimosarum]
MFSWNCQRSNGTHLTYCMDRFYFGSCCKLPPGVYIATPPSVLSNEVTVPQKYKPRPSTRRTTTEKPTTKYEFSSDELEEKRVSTISTRPRPSKPTKIPHTEFPPGLVTWRPLEETVSTRGPVKVKPTKFFSNKPLFASSTTKSKPTARPKPTTQASRRTTIPSTSTVTSSTRRKTRPTRPYGVTSGKRKTRPTRPYATTNSTLSDITQRKTKPTRPYHRPTSKPTTESTTVRIGTWSNILDQTTRPLTVLVTRRTTPGFNRVTTKSTRSPYTTKRLPEATRPPVITRRPATRLPVTQSPTRKPTTRLPVIQSTTRSPTTRVPITQSTTRRPTTRLPVTQSTTRRTATRLPITHSTTGRPITGVPTVQPTSRRPATRLPVPQSSRTPVPETRPTYLPVTPSTTLRPAIWPHYSTTAISTQYYSSAPTTNSWPSRRPTTAEEYQPELNKETVSEIITFPPFPGMTSKTTERISLFSTTPSVHRTSTVRPQTTTQKTTSLITSTTESPSSIFPSTTEKPTSLQDYTKVCGRPMPGPVGRIVGGGNSYFGEWPWVVSLRQWKKNTFLHKCGAALLNEFWAITAAHCVENVPLTDILLRLGEYDISHENEPLPYVERRVQIVASHPKFDRRTFEYDLALLRFYEPVTFQKNILPICVPSSNNSYVGKYATVTGWGRLREEGPLPDVIQEVSLPVITNKLCESMYQDAGFVEDIPDIFICAGYADGGKDSCEGDSGGPMVIQEDDGRWVLAGVISWGIGCALPNQPGVYTRITKFSEW